MNPEILGTIFSAKDGILYILGLSSVKQSELLLIDKKRKYTQTRKFEAYLEDRLKQEEDEAETEKENKSKAIIEKKEQTENSKSTLNTNKKASIVKLNTLVGRSVMGLSTNSLEQSNVNVLSSISTQQNFKTSTMFKSEGSALLNAKQEKDSTNSEPSVFGDDEDDIKDIPFDKLTAQIFEIQYSGQVQAILLAGLESKVSAGMYARSTRMFPPVKTGYGALGLGMHIEGTAYCYPTHYTREYLLKNILVGVSNINLERPAAGIINRLPIKHPTLTGINMVDFLLPIGSGQRELIIGDKNTGKTTLAMTIVINQRYYNNCMYLKWRIVEKTYSFLDRHFTLRPCVYLSIGQRRSEIFRIYDVFTRFSILNYTALLFTTAEDNPGLLYLSPFAATAVCEWFAAKGHHSVLVLDDLSGHAVAYRQLSLLLRRPPGREAYPGDVFYTHSRLLERTAQYNKNFAAGSITCFPIIETRGNDISAYIPTNVISITDGQIFLSLEVRRNGLLPAIEFGLSVSRVGSSAQVPFVVELSKEVKKLFMTYLSLARLERMGGINDRFLLERIRRGRRLEYLFTQTLYESMRLYKQIVSVLAIVNGLADTISELNFSVYVGNIFHGNCHLEYVQSNVDHTFYVYSYSLFLFESYFTTFGVSFYGSSLLTFLKSYSTFFKNTFGLEVTFLGALESLYRGFGSIGPEQYVLVAEENFLSYYVPKSEANGDDSVNAEG
jgi:proton translocating ATP synthase F1 alpha subunit